MVLDWLRLLRGYVEFEAEGRFPERLLNLTVAHGVSLWDAVPREGGLRGKMFARDYRRIRPCMRRAKLRAHITKKHGLPFLLLRYRGRIGLPIGAAAGVALLVFLSCFVWSFSVEGAQHLSETQLLSVLAENGVSVGSFKGAVDVYTVQRNTLLKLDELRWMSINIKGCVAEIEVKEKVPKPDLGDDTPCNLKASSDGVVTDLNVSSGSTEVTRGSGVAKGDLLVSGMSLTQQNTVRYLHAAGEVYADVNSKKEINMQKSYNYYSLTENKTNRSRFGMLHLSFPATLGFGSYADAACSVSEQCAVLNGTPLPLTLKTETAHELAHEPFTHSKATARRAFVNTLLLCEAFEKGESTVKQRKLTVTESKDGFLCRADYIFNENIAETSEFSVTESE